MRKAPSPMTIDDVQRIHLEAMLKWTKGNRTEAAKLMDISVRTLRNWVRKYDLSRKFPPIGKKRK